MNRLLRRSRSAKGSPARADSFPYWKQVPEVNLVSRRRVKVKRTHLARAVLALAIILVGVWLQDLYRTRLDIDDTVGLLSSRLRTVQRQVNSSNSQINDLRAQIDEIEKEQGLQQRPYEAVRAERIDWDQALLALFQARVDGVEFRTLLTERGTSVKLEGSVDNNESMVDFQNRLRNSEGLLRLVTFNISRSTSSGNPSEGQTPEETLEFSATIEVEHQTDEHQP